MRVVAITGVDGTGKSTLASLLVKELRARGIPARRIYGRITPVFARLLMYAGKLIFLGRSSYREDYRAYVAKRGRVLRRPVLSWAYAAAIQVESVIQIWLKLLPSLFSNGYVVADRYLYDTVIGDLALHLSYSEEEFEKVLQRGFHVVPRPYRTFLLHGPIGLSLMRKADVPHPDYIAERRGWYEKIGTGKGVHVLDAGERPDQLLETVLDDLTTDTCPPREFEE